MMEWKEKLSYGIIFGVIITALSLYLTPISVSSVEGHSMEPTISDGDAVVIVPTGKKDIQVGDVIAFKPEPDRKVIHRVIRMENGKIRTMGDNSEEPDSWIEPSQVVGKHLLTIPYIGTVLNHVNSTTGFILLVIAPAALIVYNEARRIKKEIRKNGE